MMTRIVLVSVGWVWHRLLPDAESYGDAGCNTLQRLAAISKGLTLPNLEQLGLGLLGQFPRHPPHGSAGGLLRHVGVYDERQTLAGRTLKLAGYVIEDGPTPL